MPSIVGHAYMYDKHQKYTHRKKIIQKYRTNKLLFIIKELIDKKNSQKKFMGEVGNFPKGILPGGIFPRTTSDY